jgi:hypothetical protein
MLCRSAVRAVIEAAAHPRRARLSGLSSGLIRLRSGPFTAQPHVLLCQVRTLLNSPGRPRDPLESVLGATPHEFESRILRHCLNRQNEDPGPLSGRGLHYVLVSVLVSFISNICDIQAKLRRRPLPIPVGSPTEPAEASRPEARPTKDGYGE